MKDTPTTSTSTQTTTLPQWLNNASQATYNSATGLNTSPYSGQGVAGLTPQQIQAMQLEGQTVGQGTGIANGAVTGATNAMNFTAPQLTASGINSNVAGLMNPYQQSVVDAANAQIDRNNTLTKQANNSAAAKANAFGGDRAAIVNGMADRDANTNKATTDANLLQSGYNTALTTALNMGTANQGAAINGAAVNLNGANALSGIGTNITNLNNADVQGLLSSGGVLQNNNQAGLTFDYNNWLQSQQAALQKQQAMQNAVSGAKTDTTTNGSTTTDQWSNPLMQIAGLGLGVAGLMSGNPAGLSGISGLLGNGSSSGSPNGNFQWVPAPGGGMMQMAVH